MTAGDQSRCTPTGWSSVGPQHRYGIAQLAEEIRASWQPPGPPGPRSTPSLGSSPRWRCRRSSHGRHPEWRDSVGP